MTDYGCVKATDRIRAAATEALATDLSKADRELLSDLGDAYPLQAIQVIQRTLRSAGKSGVWIHELLAGSAPFVPEVVKPPEDPAKIRAREELRARYEEAQYQKLVGHFEKPYMNRDIADNALKSYGNQLSMGASILVSMATMFVVCYYLAGTMELSSVMCSVCGMFGMVGILVVEVTLIIIRMDEMETSIHGKRTKKKVHRIG